MLPNNWPQFTTLCLLSVTVCACLLAFALYEDLHKPPVLVKKEKKPIVYSKAVEPAEIIENGIHVETGLVYESGFEVVRTTCTHCHSAKLVTQNRATRGGWKQMIVWMQKTQGLWELGPSEAEILDYLAAHYSPTEVGRRASLDLAETEWYELEQ